MTPIWAVPLLTLATSVSLSGSWCAPALALSALSQVTVAASPMSAATEVTIGWKSVSDGAMSSLPFHFGSARSSTEVGRSAGLRSLVL